MACIVPKELRLSPKNRMWLSATKRIGLLLAILFILLVIVYLRHFRVSSKEPFVISNDALIELGQKGVKCPKGSFCPPLSGKAFLCPGGTYGESEGLITTACSGLCEPGYVCDAGSVSKTAKQCPGGFYCIAGTASVGPITPTICPEGYFCPPGSAAPQKCGEMETCPEGTGACPPGNTECGGTPQSGPVSTPTKLSSASLNQALRAAIYNNNVKSAKAAIDEGANVNESAFSSVGNDAWSVTSGMDVTPIIIAVATGYSNMVKLLLENGANYNIITKFNSYTPLQFAYRFKQKYDESKDWNGGIYTKIYIERINEYDKIIQLLKDAGAK